MINSIKTNKTFASFVLFTCILTSPVGRIGCFFAPAEIQFALEIVRLLRNSASVQSLSESVCVLSCVCLLVLSFLSVLRIIFVPACVAGLVLMRFCARTVAEMALLALKSFCSTIWLLFGRRAAVCFVLLNANGCVYREDVLLQKDTEFSVRLETLRLTMFRPVAPVLDATGKQFDLKRNHRVIFQVSFVFVLFIMVIAFVAACGDARWIGTSAVGLYLLFAELRRSSAATAIHNYLRLGDFETSSSFALDPIRHVCEFSNKRVVWNAHFRCLLKERGLLRVRFAPDDNLLSFCFIERIGQLSAREYLTDPRHCRRRIGAMPFAPIKTKPAAESSISSASTVLASVRVKLFKETIDKEDVDADDAKRKRDLEDAFVNASLVRNLKRRKLCQDPVPVVDSVNMELDEDKASLDDPVDMGVDAMLSSVHAMPSSKKSCSPRLLRTRPYLERKCKVVVCLRMRPYFARQCKKNVRVLVV
ncbi:hypothetical protein FisN_5Hu265 [Fistulifera solaris]|uniref:Uncharacterized protein n=1 Tax=Fistulifera solaris TaxID=1519565 RepID=A0A1Z5JS94_FISSO|nr:hypothetical protein FisN_5Hu265 [Fistulifera solaris]|eukprot:GAX16890.1 hypothetical protein FisN_5Hu265 [Fistulifera solaris]